MDWYESKDRVDCGYINMRRLSPEELQEILANHRLWLSTNRRHGSRADLANTYLRNHKMKGECLQSAILTWASISNNALNGVDLSGAEPELRIPPASESHGRESLTSKPHCDSL
jgi:hypothetical protein